MRSRPVVVVDHNLDVIKTADWLVDFGPEGGDGGGQIIAVGTPEQVASRQAGLGENLFHGSAVVGELSTSIGPGGCRNDLH
jgi:excinuclease UvrABC ATPase subunit